MSKSEHDLLELYLHAQGGLVFTEVTVGRGGPYVWPKASKPRYLDGVRLPGIRPARIEVYNRRTNGELFETLMRQAHVEVIEVKRVLNRLVIGQAIVGADLLAMGYQPAEVRPVIVCEVGDPLLEIVCQRRGIAVWRPGFWGSSRPVR